MTWRCPSPLRGGGLRRLGGAHFPSGEGACDDLAVPISSQGGLRRLGGAHLPSREGACDDLAVPIPQGRGLVTTWQCPPPLKGGGLRRLGGAHLPSREGPCDDLAVPISSASVSDQPGKYPLLSGGACDDLAVPISPQGRGLATTWRGPSPLKGGDLLRLGGAHLPSREGACDDSAAPIYSQGRGLVTTWRCPSPLQVCLISQGKIS